MLPCHIRLSTKKAMHTSEEYHVSTGYKESTAKMRVMDGLTKEKIEQTRNIVGRRLVWFLGTLPRTIRWTKIVIWDPIQMQSTVPYCSSAAMDCQVPIPISIRPVPDLQIVPNQLLGSPYPSQALVRSKKSRKPSQTYIQPVLLGLFCQISYAVFPPDPFSWGFLVEIQTSAGN